MGKEGLGPSNCSCELPDQDGTDLPQFYNKDGVPIDKYGRRLISREEINSRFDELGRHPLSILLRRVLRALRLK